MGSLFTRLFRSQRPLKVVIVGLANAGKTTLLYRLKLGEAVSTRPTLGCNLEEVSHGNVSMKVWDLGGQDSLRSMWSFYFSKADAVVFVLDSSDKNGMDLARSELTRLLDSPELRAAFFLILANKQDVSEALGVNELIPALGLNDITSNSWGIHGISALDGEGVEGAFDWLIESIAKRQ